MRPLMILIFLLSAACSCVAAGPPSDPGYEQALKAYRGELNRKELDALDELDPAPGMYTGPKTPGERDVTRLFASLPQEAHATLRDDGYLKWRADSLPAQQQRWVKDAVKLLTIGGVQAFPLEGKAVSLTGF